MFWYLFRFQDIKRLPDIFFVWVSCYGVIAPVQAWSFANSLFDTRQAKRLFGLIGAGASLGAMSAGVLARVAGRAGRRDRQPPAGAGVLIALAAAIVLLRTSDPAAGTTRDGRFRARLQRPGVIVGTPYLRLLAGLVFAVAIATQWSSLQQVVSKAHFQGNSQDITEFYGTFSFVTGVLSFLVQLLITGRVLRTWGMSAGILALRLRWLPATADLPGTGLLERAGDQRLRSGPAVLRRQGDLRTAVSAHHPGKRVSIKNAIDIVVNRIADGIGAVLLGLATNGFLFLPGLHLGLRGTAAINLVTVGSGPRWPGGSGRNTSAPSRTAFTATGWTPSVAPPR